jgi:hypothetical protein
MRVRGSFAQCLIVFVALNLAGCSPPPPAGFPPIKDDLNFMNECDLLLSNPKGPIDPSKWPQSIRSLNPISVETDSYTITITTYRGVDGSRKGYIVYPRDQSVNPTQGDAHWKIKQSGYAFTYTFEYTP